MGELVKTITSLQHPLVKRLAELRKERKTRRNEGCAVLEGRKLVGENCALINTLLTTEEAVDFALPAGAEVYRVSPEIIQKISGVKSPEGVLAEVRIPRLELPSSVRRLLVLDRVNDPGNLGTLIRSALAFAWDGVYLLGSCCDPFNDKAIRASKGAVLRLPIVEGKIASLKALLAQYHLSVYVADLEGKAVNSVAPPSRLALILGSEAHGPSAEAQALGEKITIPISNQLDSLNVAVAGGILLHSLEIP